MSGTGEVEAHEFPTRAMSPEEEAGLITVLAQRRATQAARHRVGCTCAACRLRHHGPKYHLPFTRRTAPEGRNA